MKIRTPFYSEIARKVAISQVAVNAVEKKFGWKQNDKGFLCDHD